MMMMDGWPFSIYLFMIARSKATWMNAQNKGSQDAQLFYVRDTF
jgi:hypothetical protein